MRVLIYYNENKIKPTGGPSGYIYNLKKYLNSDYVFLKNNYKEKKFNIEKIRLPRFVKMLLKNISRRKKSKQFLKVSDNSVDFSDYDIVHFHQTFDLYRNMNNLTNYKGIVVLTSHSPKPTHQEIIHDWITANEYNRHKKIYDKLEAIDKFAFSRADYVIFPCLEAMEPYELNRPWFNRNFDLIKNKSLFLLTGTRPIKLFEKPNEIRKLLNIPENAFVISFVGRHLSVKGYDLLLKAYNCLNKDVYFFICGNLNPNYKTPQSNRRIEIGWTNKPMDYVNCSDLFVLPNKETYFDLVLLEVISIGKISLVSYTGGNKFISKLSKGLFTFSSFDEMIQKIDMISKLDKAKISEYSVELKNLYKTLFTDEIFAQNYVYIIKNIFNNRINK